VLLAVTYFIAEVFHSGVKKPSRLLFLLSPVLVFIVTGLASLVTNGYFFFPAHIGMGASLEPDWFLSRFSLFGIHLISEDFRWLLIITALAGMIRGKGRDTDRRLLPFVLILLFPALFSPPERIAFLGFVTVVLAAYFIRERLVLSRLHTVFAVFPVLMVMFHVLIVLISPDSSINLLRYVLSAYPVIVLGPMVMLRKYFSGKTTVVLGSIFIVATAGANRFQHPGYQPGASLASVSSMMDYKEAVIYGVSLGDTMLVSGIDERYFSTSECGVVRSAVPVRNIQCEQPLLEEGVSYTLVVSSFMLAQGNIAITEALVPPGSELRVLREPVWKNGTDTVEIYRVEPSGFCFTERYWGK
jgi:hypothetical protein